MPLPFESREEEQAAKAKARLFEHLVKRWRRVFAVLVKYDESVEEWIEEITFLEEKGIMPPQKKGLPRGPGQRRDAVSSTKGEYDDIIALIKEVFHEVFPGGGGPTGHGEIVIYPSMQQIDVRHTPRED